jgi:hypothetical protein
VNRFFYSTLSPTLSLLMFIRAVALLVNSIVIVIIGLTKLLLKLDMHPSFLRAGWRNEFLNLHTILDRPSVSVSFTGGTAGTYMSWCVF